MVRFGIAIKKYFFLDLAVTNKYAKDMLGLYEKYMEYQGIE